jgi:ubiquinone/menaquinone biosynthesis C-methylase UbiE
MNNSAKINEKQEISMLRVFKQMILTNGFLWTAYVIPYVFVRKIFKDYKIEFLDRRIKYLEKRNNLPGMNSTELNSIIWNSWNWGKSGGEEWTKSKEWKQSLIDEVMLKYFKKNKTVLEIGPGAGKWTESLQQLAQKLILVDISKKCIEICKKRFHQCNNVTYFVTKGLNLSFLPNVSIDYIWSFDVFVHIAPDDIENYIKEFNRVLKPKGRGIIHHAGEGGLQGGWRSSVTNQLIAEFLEKNDLRLITQFDSWGGDNQFNVKYYHDTISIFDKI